MKPALLLLIAAGSSLASSPAMWEMSSYTEFIKGRFENVALTRGGQIVPARRFDTVFSSTEPYLWTLAAAPDGSLYAATGNRGQLYRIDPAGQSTLVWTAPQPEIFSIAVDSKGVVYAGTSPGGKVYRIEGGKAAEYFDPKATYIWALALRKDGTLFVGTGNQGNVYRVTGAGKGEVYYATGQGNVTSLSFDREDRLLAGTEPNGILYQISARDKAFVLYDANLPEIRAISTDPDGSIYAMALGGSVAHKTQNAAQGGAGAAVSGIPSVSTSITVTAEAAQAGAVQAGPVQSGGDARPPTPAEPAKAQAVATPQPPAQTAGTVVDLTGVEKSAIYKIHPDHTVETLWSSKEENAYDLIAGNGEVLFGTDVNARIYRFTPDRKLALVQQANEGEITRLLRVGSNVYAATSNRGRLYRLSDAPAASGVYESPVYDAGSVARWGHLSWMGSGSPKILTRTGNSLRPDRTWSDWAPAGAGITSPNARYIQWKTELGAGGAIDSVAVAYLPQNNPPVVRSITVLAVAQAAPSPTKTNGAATAAYSITVTDTGDAGPSTSTGTQIQTITRASSQNLVVTWQAEDPDGDKLVFALYFRGEGERDWKPLKINLHENSFTIDGDALADGRYSFRVVASDREVNAPGLEAELVSTPALIDNTPPVITTGVPQPGGLDFEAADNVSALKRCEYSIDAGPWIPLSPVDGFLDSRKARFHLDLSGRPAGEHVLVLRAIDSGNNAGLAKIILR